MASSDTTESADCDLCELPTGARPVTDVAVDGVYCCNGCLAVADAMDNEAIEPAASNEGGDRSPDTVPDGAETTFLAIDGMHCTTCEAFLNARGATANGIHAVEASYATDTARVQYDPDSLDPDEIVHALSGYGYTARVRREGERERDDGNPLVSFLIGGGLFGMMVMLWYALFLYPSYFGFEPIVSTGRFEDLYIYGNIWLFTSFVLFYTGKPILRGAYVSLRARAPNMDLLVAVAALSAYAYSTLAMGLGRSDLYFDVSVAIILVVTAGTYYEERMKRRALGDLASVDVAGDSTARLANGTEVDRSDLTPGDTVLVRPGERIPLDGEVRDGSAAVDTSLLTGEARPREVKPGDVVPGGAVVTDAPIEVAVREESTRDRLLELLWSIQTSTPGMQRLADRLATIFVPLVFVLAAIVGIGSLVAGANVSSALLLALTVMIVACPCALGLATPLGIAAGVKAGLERGIVIARASVFEEAPEIDIVVLDKTGTLTEGAMRVRDVIGETPDAVLSRAAAVEQYSAHPIAAAIVEHAEATLGWSPDVVTDGGEAASVRTDRSRGLSAEVDGEEVAIGHPQYLRQAEYEIEDRFAAIVSEIQAAGDRPVLVGWDGKAQGVIRIGDTERGIATETISRLAEAYEVIVLTGDEGPSADRYRSDTGVAEVFAGVPPEGKAETVRRLRGRGRVAMVGDGSNDAPALAVADLGIAITSGTALATDAADAMVEGEDLASVVTLFDVVKGTKRRIRQNLGWAFVYNGIAIPLAITGLLNPFLAAVAMATSSILVVSNSARPIVRS